MVLSTIAIEHQTCFQLKTSFAPCTVLQFVRYDLAALKEELVEAVSHAPKFFQGSPIVIDLDKIKSLGELDFDAIKQILLDNNLIPVGVRGGSPEQRDIAALHGLPALTIGKLSHVETPSQTKKVNERTEFTKLITTPVRSGMQVYAKNADLIVTAPVSAGAELLADGHIHVYGPLRGRALAGVQGNTQARIFCTKLEAELVSIAGYYLTKEDIQVSSENRGMIQVYLAGQQVKIEIIS